MALRLNTNAPALVLPAPSDPQATTAGSTNALRDIKPPVKIPPGWSWLLWTLGALALLAALWWGWKRWRKQKARQATPPKQAPPHERARKALEAALKMIDQPKPFCIAVSDTVRLYLEERFSLHAPERTTEEFLFELTTSALLEHEQKESLAKFLTQCDLVKFARYEPEHYELQGLHDTALKLITQTEPRPIPLPNAAQAGRHSPTPA